MKRLHESVGRATPSPSSGGRSFALSTLLPVLLLMGGCATKSDVRDLQGDLEQIRADQDRLVDRIDSRMRSTTDSLGSLSEREVQWRAQILQEIQALRRAVDQLSAQVGAIQQGQTGMRDELSRLQATRSAPMGQRPGGGAAGGSGDAALLLRDIQRDIQLRNFATAEAGLELFLEDYPNDPSAPHAMFLLGDVLQLQDQPEEALEVFLGVQERFPSDREWTPNALYRAADLQVELGNVAEARRLLTRITNTYPEHPIRDAARERLREIGGS